MFAHKQHSSDIYVIFTAQPLAVKVIKVVGFFILGLKSAVRELEQQSEIFQVVCLKKSLHLCLRGTNRQICIFTRSSLKERSSV